MEPLRRFFGHPQQQPQSYPNTMPSAFPATRSERPCEADGGGLRFIFDTSHRSSSVPDLHQHSLPNAEPEFFSVPLSRASSLVARRPRLDESAGEGLRRSVLVRNAMLSSLEREWRQSSQTVSNGAEPSSSNHEIVSSDLDQADVWHTEPNSAMGCEYDEQEVQWFEDLLNELSTTPQEVDDDDFVQVQAPGQEDINISSFSSPDDLVVASVDSPSDDLQSISGIQPVSDSGFAQESSRVTTSSLTSRFIYPHVCPYPAVGLTASSSEELPALVDDDSDVEDDEDDDGSPLAELDQGLLQNALSSRPVSPDDPQLELVAAIVYFSSALSRPTSPAASSSSKGDSSDSCSPVLDHSMQSMFPPRLSDFAPMPPSSVFCLNARTENLDLAVAHLYQCTTRNRHDLGTMAPETMAPFKRATFDAYPYEARCSSSRPSPSADSPRTDLNPFLVSQTGGIQRSICPDSIRTYRPSSRSAQISYSDPSHIGVVGQGPLSPIAQHIVTPWQGPLCSSRHYVESL